MSRLDQVIANRLPRFIQVIGAALILGGVFTPLWEFLSSQYTWTDLYGAAKYYFHGRVLELSLPLALLGVLMMVCGAYALYWKNRALKVEEQARARRGEDSATQDAGEQQ